MHTQYFFLDYGSDGHGIESIDEDFPKLECELSFA